MPEIGGFNYLSELGLYFCDFDTHLKGGRFVLTMVIESH